MGVDCHVFIVANYSPALQQGSLRGVVAYSCASFEMVRDRAAMQMIEKAAPIRDVVLHLPQGAWSGFSPENGHASLTPDQEDSERGYLSTDSYGTNLRLRSIDVLDPDGAGCDHTKKWFRFVHEMYPEHFFVAVFH